MDMQIDGETVPALDCGAPPPLRQVLVNSRVAPLSAELACLPRRTSFRPKWYVKMKNLALAAHGDITPMWAAVFKSQLYG